MSWPPFLECAAEEPDDLPPVLLAGAFARFVAELANAVVRLPYVGQAQREIDQDDVNSDNSATSWRRLADTSGLE